MIHLLPLPGSPGARPLVEVRDAALRDAAALLSAGFDGLVVENFGDVPFHKDEVPPITVSAMTWLASALRERMGGRGRLCINVLRNDARAALAVAAAVGAEAIRVNVHAGARLTDQGVVEGRADRTLRLRREWSAESVALWADVAVKHSAPLGAGRPVAEEAEELCSRSGADAVIVTGTGTGRPLDPDQLAEVARAVDGRASVLAGSGVHVDNIGWMLEHCDGVIVGTSVKKDGRTTEAVDPQRARDLVAAAG